MLRSRSNPQVPSTILILGDAKGSALAEQIGARDLSPKAFKIWRSWLERHVGTTKR
jgi:hypothetical protein